MRFIYWDEYYPVQYAHTGCVPVGDFLSVYQGKPTEARQAQNHHDGNEEVEWHGGAAMTGPKEGLWDPVPKAGPGTFAVTKENIRHMQNRVELFEATGTIPQKMLRSVPNCKETFCAV